MGESTPETIELRPVGWVRGSRQAARDDHWGGVASVIELDASVPDKTIAGLEEFSHLEVVFHFHQVEPDTVCTGARHPRNNPAWPCVGIFAQRARRRPNRLGVSRCRLDRVQGRRIRVLDLDAIEGTPVVDIKPYFRETAPLGSVEQAPWSTELMADYYRESDEEGS